MSGTVDDEVVRMRFDNNGFERAVASTISVLAKLKNSLSFSGSGKDLDAIESKANKFNLAGMASGIESIKSKFSALSVIGVTALATITQKAVSAGVSLIKSFTLDPVTAGFKNYETQINAVQTILANTGLKGAAGLSQVNKTLDQLNTYANQTVYNFSDMTKNIGTFTAAGVKLKPATDAIKGIANLAALSGSTADQASTAMYQLSQAIAANKVGLQDWNSVVNAGMGGKVFQQALFNTGKLEHTLKGVKANETFDQWTKSGNSFRNSLKSGWITGKVLTDTLSQFTGDLTDAQLKAMGYNKTQIAQIQELAKTAKGAATNIKTFSQLTSALKEEVATAFAAIFKTIFGDINGATKLFSGIHTVVENALTVPIYALNTMLQKVTDLGGRAKAIDAIKNVFHALGAVLKPISQAFRDIFPAKSAKDIVNIINVFDNFTKKLIISKQTAQLLSEVFQGVFAAFDIGKMVLSGLFHVFATLFSTIFKGSGGLLKFAANIAYMVWSFDQALHQGDALSTFFSRIGHILAIPIKIIHDFASAIGKMFSGFHGGDAKGVTSGLNLINEKLLSISNAGDELEKFFAGLSAKIQPAIKSVVKAFSQIGHAIASGLNSQAFGNILKGIQVGLLGGIVVLLKKFFSKGINVDIGGGIFGQAREALEGVTGSLKAMQTQLKAKALLEIAAAMGILALAVIALASVNSEKLASALKAMAVGFGELLGSMAILVKISGTAGFVKLPLMAASLDLLATSILILAAAVKIMASMSWDELKKGLTGVGALLAEVSGAALIISKNSGSMISAGIGITAMAVAINILALAVKQFAGMSWKELGKGLAGVAGSLIAVVGAMRLMPTQGMIAASVGLLLISVALQAIYVAVLKFSSFKWGDMVKGLVGVAGALIAIAAGMRLMPKGMLLQAAALAVLAGSLQLIEKVMVSMAKLSWSTIGKGLGTIGAALAVLALGMNAMDGALPGAAALAIAAASLSLLMPIIQKLGGMSWGDIAKGLLTFAGALGVLLLAATGAQFVVVGLAALGLAALAIGAGLALAGAGILALSAGLSLLATTGSAGVAVLISAIQGVIAQIPALAVAFAQGLVNVLKVIATNGPAIIAGFSTIIGSILTAVSQNVPKLAALFEQLIQAALAVIVKEAPNIIAAGLSVLMDLLNGIKNNIGKVTTTVASIIVNFLNALAKNLPRIIAAGVNLLTKFLVGIASALGKMPGVVLQVVNAFLRSLFGNFGKIVSAGVSMIGKLAGGIASGVGRMASAGISAIGRFISGIGSRAIALISAGEDVLGHVVDGIVEGIKHAVGSIVSAAISLGASIVRGVVHGLGNIASSVGSAIKSGVGSAIHAVGSFLHIGGPSMVFADEVGRPIMLGISKGVELNAHVVSKSLNTTTGGIVKEFAKTMSTLPDMVSDVTNLTPTITPVLDLTNVQKDATRISNLMTVDPLAVDASLNAATDISADANASKSDTDTSPEPAPAPTITFQQTNTSPKALSTIEIYRNTNNLLSQAKNALKVPS